jgi:putative tricarboxylic transport membrane protein
VNGVSWTRPRIAGAVLLAIGVIALIATFSISSPRYGWSITGPRFAPLIASIALILLALAFLLRTWWRQDRGWAEHVHAELSATHWPTPGLLLALLIAYVLLLGPLGYALATTIFVWLAAWLLGSDRPVRDVTVGLALGVVAGIVFGEWLNVQLPTGPWGV